MFQGSYVAIVTPFRDGQVDYAKLGELVEFHAAQGTSGLVPCGTTGESATLSEDEHERVIEFTIEKAAGRMKILAGTGSNSTATAIKLTRHAEKAGADGALLITPYYNKPTQEGLYRHYRAVAEAAAIPLVLYNVPGRTGVNLAPETVGRLAKDVPSIVGLKDATGSLVQASETLALVAPEFDLLSGEDAIVLPLLSIGAKGVISVFGNVAPRSMADLIRLWNEGKRDEARALHFKHLALAQALFLETNPIPVKAALELMGLCSAEVRLPLVPMTDGARQKLRAALQGFGLV